MFVLYLLYVFLVPRNELRPRDCEKRSKTPGGGHLGIFWVGMCRPGLQIGTLF